MTNMDNEVTEIRQLPDMVDGVPDQPDGQVAPEPQVSPGMVLGNYRLDTPIGAGLTSQLFEADSLVAGKRCVVKVFRPELGCGPVEFGRYAHEVRQVSQLGHPAICDVYHSARVDDWMISAMTLEAGAKDLRSLVRNKAPLSRRVYLPVVRGICEALGAVHGLGLSHLRLHGGQVMVRMVERAVSVKVLDFGTHHLLPGIKEVVSGWERGPEDAIYTAPELAKELPGDARSDIYSICVMLYEMLTGKVPFLGSTFADTLEQHLSEPPPPPGKLVQLPAEVEDVVMRGLEKDPRKRIPSVEALLAALDPRGATGAHAVVGAGATTGRMALTPSQSKEYHLAEMAADQAAPHAVHAPAAAHPGGGAQALAPEMELGAAAPRTRVWLLVVLVVVALVVGGVVAYLVLGGKKQEKRPRGKRRASPAVVVPKKTAPTKPATRPTPRAPAPKKTAPTKPAARAPSAAPQPAPKPPAPAPARRGRTVKVSGDVKVSPMGKMLHLRGLRLNKGVGSITVATGAAEAKVYVNGHLKGSGAEVNLKGLPVGKHRIQLEVNGKKLPYKDVQVKKGQRLDLSF